MRLHSITLTTSNEKSTVLLCETMILQWENSHIHMYVRPIISPKRKKKHPKERVWAVKSNYLITRMDNAEREQNRNQMLPPRRDIISIYLFNGQKKRTEYWPVALIPNILGQKELIWVYIGVKTFFWNTNRRTRKYSFCTYFSHITLSLINCIQHYSLAGELFGSNICQELTRGMQQLRTG